MNYFENSKDWTCNLEYYNIGWKDFVYIDKASTVVIDSHAKTTMMKHV